MKNIDSKELIALVAAKPEAVIIDVRTMAEVDEGMIPGALHLDLFEPEFVDRIKALERDKPYIMVCRSGGRSASACGAMLQWGFKEVYNLAGGMTEWTGEVTREV